MSSTLSLDSTSCIGAIRGSFCDNDRGKNATQLKADIITAVYKRSIEEVRSLIMQGASVHTVEKDGSSLLNIACRLGYSAIARFLIINGAEVNAVSSDGTTPLFEACFEGQETTVRLLLEKEAVNTLSSYSCKVGEVSFTPFTAAVMGAFERYTKEGNLNCARLLLTKKQVNASIKRGETQQTFPSFLEETWEIAKTEHPAKEEQYKKNLAFLAYHGVEDADFSKTQQKELPEIKAEWFPELADEWDEFRQRMFHQEQIGNPTQHVLKREWCIPPSDPLSRRITPLPPLPAPSEGPTCKASTLSPWPDRSKGLAFPRKS